mmetsp:Transcript_19468/g.45656  ORF Transcript_19468/g.45656 Transcript_19468/m.45656 type:complete len:96 (+) Transcript_19468:643-930(+)
MSAILDSVEVIDPEDGLARWRSLGGMPTALFPFGAFGAAERDGGVTDEEGGEGESASVFVFGGQAGHDAGCKCFRTTDQMVFRRVFCASDRTEEG